jgi:hypothetical protein
LSAVIKRTCESVQKLSVATLPDGFLRAFHIARDGRC